MVYNTQNYWFFGLFPLPGILENTKFRKPDLFPSSDEGGGKDTYSDGPLRNNPHLHLRTETNPVSETSCSLEYQTKKVHQNPVIL
jgi:hypothetical protein